MTAAATLPRVSPDGRFEIRVERWHDRAPLEIETTLIARDGARVLLRLGDVVDAGFAPDGTVQVAALSWTAAAVRIDPVTETFRVGDEQPWLPLAAWTVAEAAYLRGWQHQVGFQLESPSGGFPWVELGMASGAGIVVLLLILQHWLPPVPALTLLVLAALTAILFTYLFLLGLIRRHRLQRALRRWR
jgi:hypothetical protein